MTRHFHDNGSSAAGKIIPIGIISAAAGAAITYFLYGTEKGREKRQKISDMAGQIKQKVSHATDEISAATSEMYDNISGLIKEKYDMVKNLDKEELSELANKIRDHWDDIRDDISEVLEKAESKG